MQNYKTFFHNCKHRLYNICIVPYKTIFFLFFLIFFLCTYFMHGHHIHEPNKNRTTTSVKPNKFVRTTPVKQLILFGDQGWLRYNSELPPLKKPNKLEKLKNLFQFCQCFHLWKTEQLVENFFSKRSVLPLLKLNV